VVGVLSTGTELVEPFAVTPPGKIRDSNRPMLLGLLSSWNVETKDLGVCGDSNAALEKKVVEALQSVDVLITSGGVSMGEHDLIKPLLERIGKVHFGRLHMKPGKPTTFATLVVNGQTKLVFALPGNPVSTFTTCHLLVHPALKKMQGFPESQWKQTRVYATLSHHVKLDRERPEFHRATLAWDLKTHKFVATSTGRQISSRLLRYFRVFVVVGGYGH
jgi:gephyrin